MKTGLTTIIIALIAAIAIVAAFNSWSLCKSAGGTLVKGVFWYECIGGVK